MALTSIVRTPFEASHNDNSLIQPTLMLQLDFSGVKLLVGVKYFKLNIKENRKAEG